MKGLYRFGESDCCGYIKNNPSYPKIEVIWGAIPLKIYNTHKIGLSKNYWVPSIYYGNRKNCLSLLQGWSWCAPECHTHKHKVNSTNPAIWVKSQLISCQIPQETIINKTCLKKLAMWQSFNLTFSRYAGLKCNWMFLAHPECTPRHHPHPYTCVKTYVYGR